ncbi:DUF6528 family protein [Sphingobacterium sp. CZ-2]|uniref:DUF6528 family protein n=1 Tax=Sphingobacterium sp. CZ-2 TaxID=2557994 RepID=UPI0010703984|nr:DUF6528 family protein [Sphingobacterium sp. CZ-2]QBR13245.1 hypothetical protein E3D81_14160 [Sphingobacterium sp. CZ-2]
MKRVCILFILFLVAFNTSFAQQVLKKGFLVACGDDKLFIIDPNKSNDNHTEIIWKWAVADAKSLPAAYIPLLKSLDECKPVMGNKKILVTSSTGATILVDIASKDVEFYAKTPMAHSVDLLPNNRIIVANSTHPKGNSIELYDLKKNERVLFTDSLYSGHGVAWNPKDKLLYVLGYQHLKTYSLVNWSSENPSLKLESSWQLPDKSGHDLFRIDRDTFLVSTHHSVFLFNSNNKSFTDFTLLKGKKDVKSVNYYPKKNSLIYTVAEESWWTENIYMVNPNKTIKLPNLKLYKVRKAI